MVLFRVFALIILIIVLSPEVSFAAGRGTVTQSVIAVPMMRLRPGMHGWTELMEAVSRGKIEKVRILLNNGAKVDVKSKTQDTALAVASAEGDLKIVNLLLKNGAKPDLVGRRGRTPLMIATYKGHLDIVNALLERGANARYVVDEITALQLASLWGHLEVVKTLIGHADLAVEGEQALNYAAMNGRSEIAEFLLKSGVGADALDSVNQSALENAVGKGDIKTVELLIHYGANIRVRSVSNKNPVFIFAVQGGSVDIAALFIRLGVDVNTKDRLGRTAMELAKKREDAQIVSLLRTHHAYEITPKIEKFHKSVISGLSKIFEVSDARLYIENRLGKPKEMIKVGEEEDLREPGLMYEMNRWVYDGIRFLVVSAKTRPPSSYSGVREIELFSENYEMTDGLRIGLPKWHFLEQLGIPLSDSQGQIEYRVHADDYGSGSYNRLLLETDDEDLVEKIIWTSQYPGSWD